MGDGLLRVFTPAATHWAAFKRLSATVILLLASAFILGALCDLWMPLPAARHHGDPHWLVSVGVVPVLETLLFASLPHYLFRFLHTFGLWCVLVGVFLGAHLFFLGSAGLAIGVAAGTILSAVYVMRRTTPLQAVFVTAAVHAAYNFVILILISN